MQVQRAPVRRPSTSIPRWVPCFTAAYSWEPLYIHISKSFTSLLSEIERVGSWQVSDHYVIRVPRASHAFHRLAPLSHNPRGHKEIVSYRVVQSILSLESLATQ